MKIKSQLTNDDGVVAYIKYEDADSFDDLLSKNVTQSYGICFYGDKLVIVYHKKKDHWTHIGGSIEKGEPYGEFISDPAGSITEIKLIDPKDYKQYFDWGKIGDRILERALEMLNK